MTPLAVRKAFKGFEFGPHCTEEELRQAESLLGEPIPQLLRQLYQSFNGFLGPTAAQFLWPLRELSTGGVSFVEMNLFYRRDSFPQRLTSQCLFYGDEGCGAQWGLKLDLPGKVIKWDAEWGEDFEIVGDDLLEVWLESKRRYDELDPRNGPK